MKKTIIKWHDFEKEGPPPDSRQVFITDGKQMVTAHFFHKILSPPDYKVAEDCMQFVNQHQKIIGEYIETENVTYWAETSNIELP